VFEKSLVFNPSSWVGAGLAGYAQWAGMPESINELSSNQDSHC
jgi:hypothetical protein